MNKDLTLLSGPLEDIYERIKGCNLLINTTPIGMNDKGVNFPFDIREVLYGANELLGEPVVYDIVYNPLKTKLLEDVFVARAFKPLKIILQLIHNQAEKWKKIFIFLGKTGKEELLQASKSWDIEYKQRVSITNKDSVVIEVNRLEKK